MEKLAYSFPEEKIQGILAEGPRLRLRRAGERDLPYIMTLEFEPENLKYIVPFDEAFHHKIITEGKASLDIIVEKHDGTPVGYILMNGLLTEAKEAEWTHFIIGEKGQGYGHEAMRLIKALTFRQLGFHRAWLDCKDYNARALHLYESEGMVREGLIRETIITNGVYENLVILGLLDREYEARLTANLEL